MLQGSVAQYPKTQTSARPRSLLNTLRDIPHKYGEASYFHRQPNLTASSSIRPTRPPEALPLATRTRVRRAPHNARARARACLPVPLLYLSELREASHLTDARTSRGLPDSETWLEAPAGYAVDAQEVKLVQTILERFSLEFASLQEPVHLARGKDRQPSPRRWNDLAARAPRYIDLAVVLRTVRELHPE